MLVLGACDSSAKMSEDQTRKDGTGVTGTATDLSTQNGTTSPMVNAGPPGPGWGEQKKVGAKINRFSLEMGRPVAAMNESGQAVVAWKVAPSNSQSRYAQVYASVYRHHAWQAPVQVCADEEPCEDPEVAINDKGDIAIAYHRIINNKDKGSYSTELWVKRAKQWEWQTAQRVSRADPAARGNYTRNSWIRLDSQGRAMVVWKEVETTPESAVRLQSSYFDRGAWSAPMRLDQRLPSYVDSFRLALNRSGSGMVVWLDATHPFDSSKPNGGDRKVVTWARAFDSGKWGKAHRLVDPSFETFEGTRAPRVGVDEQGNALVVFTERSTTKKQTIMSRRYQKSEQSWSEAFVAGPTRTEPYYKAEIALNRKGQAAIAWREDSPANDEHEVIYLRTLDAKAKAWSPSVNVVAHASDLQSPPVVGINGQGKAWVSWLQPAAKPEEGIHTRAFMPGKGLGLDPKIVTTPGTSVVMPVSDAGHVMVVGQRTVVEYSPSVGYYVSPWARLMTP